MIILFHFLFYYYYYYYYYFFRFQLRKMVICQFYQVRSEQTDQDFALHGCKLFVSNGYVQSSTDRSVLDAT